MRRKKKKPRKIQYMLYLEEFQARSRVQRVDALVNLGKLSIVLESEEKHEIGMALLKQVKAGEIQKRDLCRRLQRAYQLAKKLRKRHPENS